MIKTFVFGVATLLESWEEVGKFHLRYENGFSQDFENLKRDFYKVANDFEKVLTQTVEDITNETESQRGRYGY